RRGEGLGRDRPSGQSRTDDCRDSPLAGGEGSLAIGWNRYSATQKRIGDRGSRVEDRGLKIEDRLARDEPILNPPSSIPVSSVTATISCASVGLVRPEV